MSWKEKRLITILSIILAVLCAAVLVVLSIRYRAAQAAKDQNTVSPSDIADTAQSEYVALSYSNGSTTLSFSLNENGVWTWDSEPDFPLDDTHVKSILTILETLKPQQTLDMPEDLSVYGLDVPDVSLTATAPDDAVLTVTLGNATTDGTSYYATINSDPDHVFILAGTLRQAMQTPIYQMCRLPELPELTESTITSIQLQGPLVEQVDLEGNSTQVRNSTVLTATHAEDDSTAVSWRSGGANITDAPSLRALLEDLAALKVAECVDFRPSDDAVTFCGFQDPVTLTVNYKTATGIEGIFEMNVGTQNMGGTGRYVRFGDEPAIYLMELELLDPMMRLAYQGMEEAS